MPMEVVEKIADLRRFLARVRTAGQKISLVPTMGALHEGHLSLIREARRSSDFVVVSIYANPTQFVAGEDFDNYPRQLEADRKACESLGVDVIFAPDDAEMYGSQPLTTVAVSQVTDVLCGPHRPGHFAGVTTVVAKLFNIVQPHLAVFGQKDAQQAIVIKKMVADLNFPVKIIVSPTVREPDGLAMSSRNAYLSPDQRKQATVLYRALQMGRRMILDEGRRSASRVRQAVERMIRDAGPCSIDYVDIRGADTLTEVDPLAGRLLLAVAVRIGAARLIDNVEVELPVQGEVSTEVNVPSEMEVPSDR